MYIFTRDSIYAIARICYRPCLCLSVCQTGRKTAEVRIMKFSPYGRPIRPVFADKFRPEIPRGSPERERQTREGWVKSAVLYLYKRVYLENGSRYGYSYN